MITPLTKRIAITHVSDVTMLILHESYLNGSTLWPKKGFRAPTTANFDLNDVIEVRPIFDEFTEDGANGTLLFNMFNSKKKGARMIKQQDQLFLIMDCSIKNDVYFEFFTKGILGMGRTQLFGQIKFKFTYTPKN